MLKQYVRKTNLGILSSFLCLGAGLSLGENAAGAILILSAIGLWFYGLASYARGKGHSGWQAWAGIFYLFGLVYMLRLEDRHPSGSKAEPETAETPGPSQTAAAETPEQEASRTFAVLFNVVLNFILFIYFAALAGFMASPVFALIMKKGLPQQPAAWPPLIQALSMAGPPMLISILTYSAMKRLWRLQVSGGILQAFICGLLLAGGFPWALLPAVPALVLLGFDLVKRRGLSPAGLTFKGFGIGSAAGLLAAFAFYTLHVTWMFDFAGGLGVALNQLKSGVSKASKPQRNSIPPTLATPVFLKSAPAASTHTLVLRSGKRLEGRGFREDNGYYLTVEGMGEIYFGKNEVVSVEAPSGGESP